MANVRGTYINTVSGISATLLNEKASIREIRIQDRSNLKKEHRYKKQLRVR